MGCIVAWARASTEDLRPHILDLIRDGAEQIVANTTSDEILVFTGNTASYFYHAVKHARHSFLVPSSNLYYINEPGDFLEYHRVHSEYQRYSEVFLDPIRQEATQENKKIVLIDYSLTGRTVDAFNAMLGLEEQTEFIHLAPEHQFPLSIWSPRHTKTRKVVVVGRSLLSLANGAYLRLCPSFSSKEWGQSSHHLMPQFESSEQVAKNIALIPAVEPRTDSLHEVEETNLVDLNLLTVRFSRGEDGGAIQRQWQSGLKHDLSFFIDRAEKELTVTEWRSMDESPGDEQSFLHKVIEQQSIRPEQVDNEYIAFVLSTISTYIMYTRSTCATIMSGGDLPFIMMHNRQVRDKLGKPFLKIAKGIPITNFEEFNRVLGLTSLRDSDPEWFDRIIQEIEATTEPSLSV